jgi:hypothetical protein
VICLLIKKMCCKKLKDMPRFGRMGKQTPTRNGGQNVEATPTGKGKGKRKGVTSKNGRGAVRGSNKRVAQSEIDKARNQKAAEALYRITQSDWVEEEKKDDPPDPVRDALEAIETARTVALVASDAAKAAEASAQKAIRAVAPKKKSTGKAPARRGTGTAVAFDNPLADEAFAAATTALRMMAESDPRPAAGGADQGGAFWASHFRKSRQKKNNKRRDDDQGGLFWANRPASTKKKKRKVGDLGSSLNRAEQEALSERVKAHNPPSNRSVENSSRYIPLVKSVDALPSKCTNANKYWIPPKMISYRRRAYCMTPPKLKRRR